MRIAPGLCHLNWGGGGSAQQRGKTHALATPVENCVLSVFSAPVTIRQLYTQCRNVDNVDRRESESLNGSESVGVLLSVPFLSLSLSLLIEASALPNPNRGR